MLDGVHHLRFSQKFCVIGIEDFFHSNMIALPNALADFTEGSFFSHKGCVSQEIALRNNSESSLRGSGSLKSVLSHYYNGYCCHLIRHDYYYGRYHHHCC